jgi:ATP synthase protein I
VDPWADDDDVVDERADIARRRLSADQARAVLAGQPQVSPWRVVRFQVLVGFCLAALIGLTGAGRAGAYSALYGMAVVVVPAVLMARGLSGPLASLSPMSSAVSFMWWELVKIAVSVLMLALGPKVVQPLNWLVMLLSVVVCMKVYWVALLWRGNRKNSVESGLIKNGS